MKKSMIKPKVNSSTVNFSNKYASVRTDNITLKIETDDDVKKMQTDYIVVDSPDYIVCIVVDGKKLLIENQFRYPIGGFNYEFVAGMVDEGYTPEETAIKELKEEAGIVTDKVTMIGKIHPLAGQNSNTGYVFLCEDYKQEKKELEQYENFSHLTTEWIAIDEFNEKIASGKIKDGNALSSWALYCAYKGRFDYI